MPGPFGLSWPWEGPPFGPRRRVIGGLPSVRELEALRDQVGFTLNEVRKILARMDPIEKKVYGRMVDNLETVESVLVGAYDELEDAIYGRTLPGAKSLTEAMREATEEEG